MSSTRSRISLSLSFSLRFVDSATPTSSAADTRRLRALLSRGGQHVAVVVAGDNGPRGFLNGQVRDCVRESGFHSCLEFTRIAR